MTRKKHNDKVLGTTIRTFIHHASFGRSRKSEDTQTPNHSKATESFFCDFLRGRTGKDPMRSTQPLLSIILKLRQEPPQIKRTGHWTEILSIWIITAEFWHQESSETCGSTGSAGLLFGKQWIASKCWLDGQIGDLFALQQHPNWELNSTPPQLKAEAWNLLFFRSRRKRFSAKTCDAWLEWPKLVQRTCFSRVVWVFWLCKLLIVATKKSSPFHFKSFWRGIWF